MADDQNQDRTAPPGQQPPAQQPPETKPPGTDPPPTVPPETKPPGTDPPPTVPPETKPPETNPPPTAPPEAGDPPILDWHVTLHCEIPFKPDVLLPAWKTRLPNVSISIDFNASTENKSVFDAVVRIGASSNAGACSMASGLLKRHFQTIEILDMGAESV